MESVDYSVPREAQDVFRNGILGNPLIKDIPAELHSLGQRVRFEGSSKPSIPINWRFAESMAALKAFEATMLNYLITRKYKVAPIDVTINTDHASLFFMSPMLARVLEDGKEVPIHFAAKKTFELFPSRDLHRSHASFHRSLATNIYRTKDGRYYHTHGSMNPEPTLTALGLSLEGNPDDTYDSAVERIQGAVTKFDSATLDERMNEEYRQAGTIIWSSDEYFTSEHGQKCGNVGLYETVKDINSSQPAAWWPENESFPSSPQRPLASLKIVDLTRVIAGPTVGRSLAEMGASVMRVTSPNITDLSQLHQDLNWGKWNCFLDLKVEEDKEKLRALIKEADVVIDGYRPGIMERLGFGRQAIFDLVKDRSYGIIVMRENCYGWHGPWAHRSGWQQISDACCGVSMSFGQAMGNDEPVTPVFPNSDYCTGVCGSTAILEALVQRAEHGGSYSVDIALNYYSQWLVRSCGTYDDRTWNELWTRNGSLVFRHYHAMQHMLPIMIETLHKYNENTLFNPAFFENCTADNLGATFVRVKPVAQYNDTVELGYHVGTRGNGTDQPVWPKDLKVQIVSGEN
ncbi:CoA-transferase family III domain-containing protein [Hypoxylon trugodes]|uniref:CoA-transferase family III domain-containing protein n=1 Tax=Hypoxylon trugodes TaxID=326681 RepID=UPI0021A22161|nr:CoA-transferase family III domain-containing protein [Hypoxylon trugodes]KAI1394473.1 CoA-transferase family III domain-containing protein [Hypoxylon trugodes]